MTRRTDFRIAELGADEALLRRTELCELYGAAFAAPPWSERDAAYRCMTQLPRHQTWDGWRARTRNRGDGSAAGFAYGAIPPRSRSPSPTCIDASRRCWTTAPPRSRDRFEVIEIAVAPPEQGNGLGEMLLDSLVAGFPGDVWLLTIHEARGAIAVYERTGWELLAADSETTRKGRRVYRRAATRSGDPSR